MSHQLPQRQFTEKFLMTPDWRTYARIGLGLVAMQKINKVADWKPAPWLGALEAISIINPLTLGFSLASATQAVIIAPLVAGGVQLAQGLNRAIMSRLPKPAENKPHQVAWQYAPVLSQLLIAMGFGAVGLKFYPKIVKATAEQAAKVTWFPKALQKELSKMSKAEGAVGSSMTMNTCPRGCSPGSVVCMSETAEILGGFGAWIKSHFALANQDKQS